MSFYWKRKKASINLSKVTNCSAGSNNSVTMKKQYTIQVTVLLEKSFWTGIFERNDHEGYAVARKIFGGEPTDAELYEFVLTHFYELKFTEPKNFKLVIKRKNHKR